jgi:hypothetical protein
VVEKKQAPFDKWAESVNQFCQEANESEIPKLKEVAAVLQQRVEDYRQLSNESASQLLERQRLEREN